MRNRLKKFVKNILKKNELIGCDLNYLNSWFSFQFKHDMTFENYGKIWHIDHVIPCSHYDLTKKDEQKKCFHWSNLRPLYKKDNLKKSKKIILHDILMQELLAKHFKRTSPQFGNIACYDADLP